MPEKPTYGTLHVSDITIGAMLRAGVAIRRTLRGSTTVEDAATAAVQYLYEQCADDTTGERNCALVRFYKTHRYGDLQAEQRQFADALLGGLAPDAGMSCLTLVATAGDAPEWNDRRRSKAHQAIPLPSAEIVRKAPMITRLIESLGLDIEAVVSGKMPSTRASDARTYDVFHVEDAVGSQHIPAQREFVVPFGIKSVVGFGGLLRSGELFAVILFSRVTIPAASAARFRAIALDVRSALYLLDERKIWRA